MRSSPLIEENFLQVENIKIVSFIGKLARALFCKFVSSILFTMSLGRWQIVPGFSLETYVG